MVSIRELLYLGYRVIAMFTLFLMIVSGIIIVYQIRGIRAPIDKILKAAEQIEQNEWELDLYILRPYEFARIAQAIKSLGENTQRADRFSSPAQRRLAAYSEYSKGFGDCSGSVPADHQLQRTGGNLSRQRRGSTVFRMKLMTGMGNAEDRHSLIQKRFAEKKPDDLRTQFRVEPDLRRGPLQRGIPSGGNHGLSRADPRV
jgi:hypothetical protein